MTPIERAREAAARAAAEVLRDAFDRKARPVTDVSNAALDAFLAKLAEDGMVLVPREMLRHVSWIYDTGSMVYFCPWCQNCGDAEPKHLPNCGLAALTAPPPPKAQG